MFKIAQSPTYWWTVKVRQPVGGEQANQVETVDFDVEFVRLDDAAMTDFGATSKADGLSLAAMCTRVVRNWRNVVGDDGASLPFSAEAAVRVFNLAGVGAAVMDAFFGSRLPAAEKNS